MLSKTDRNSRKKTKNRNSTKYYSHFAHLCDSIFVYNLTVKDKIYYCHNLVNMV